MKKRFIQASLLFACSVLCLQSAEATTEQIKQAKKAIVIGATSGMGRQVAKKLAAEGYEVGIAGRRLSLLHTLKDEIAGPCFIKQIDVSDHEKSPTLVHELIQEMGGLDLFVISVSAANDNLNTYNELEKTQRTLSVDLLGFCYMAETAFQFFKQQGSGHLVGVSSTSGLIGEATHPVYSGAKAFIQRYLEALYNQTQQEKLSNIFITDVIPGWVEIEAEDIHQIPEAYWIATTDEAAKQIVDAIKSKKRKAYITARWEIIAFLYQICPSWIYNAVGGF